MQRSKWAFFSYDELWRVQTPQLSLALVPTPPALAGAYRCLVSLSCPHRLRAPGRRLENPCGSSTRFARTRYIWAVDPGNVRHASREGLSNLPSVTSPSL
ncbi:hypothetical protein B0H13DRAFT_2308301 [Mycena leptocephala]|nr:hypothetical protein B0H13DRAFT_2308301 [Mycena leptocephala]